MYNTLHTSCDSTTEIISSANLFDTNSFHPSHCLSLNSLPQFRYTNRFHTRTFICSNALCPQQSLIPFNYIICMLRSWGCNSFKYTVWLWIPYLNKKMAPVIRICPTRFQCGRSIRSTLTRTKRASQWIKAFLSTVPMPWILKKTVLGNRVVSRPRTGQSDWDQINHMGESPPLNDLSVSLSQHVILKERE